jgi:hypothetical protein
VGLKRGETIGCDRMGRGGEKGGPSMSASVPEQGGGGAGEGRERDAGGGRVDEEEEDLLLVEPVKVLFFGGLSVSLVAKD